MTISTTTNVAVVQCNGVTDTFDFPFMLVNETHLVVQRRVRATSVVDKTYIASEYTVAGVGTNSGSVTLIAGAPAATYDIVMTRTVPFTQELDIVNQGGFFPDTVEQQLDAIVMQIQQIVEFAQRALKLPSGYTPDDLLPAANKIIGFNGSSALEVLDLDTIAGSYVAAANAASAAAVVAQLAAEAALASTLSAYDNFDDRYLGTKAADPALDNDGNALISGALYFNSSIGEMRLWTGSAWVAAYVSGTGFVAKTGDTMTGKLNLPASAAGSAGLNLGAGVAPSAPNNGDIWTTASGLFAQIAGATEQYAKLASPAFTGNPTAPTPVAGDNDTSVATTAFVQSEQNPDVTSTASASTITPNGAVNGDDALVVTALAANLTIAAPTGAPVQMQPLIIRIKDNGTARTLTWNAIYRAIGVTLPTTTVISKTLYVGFLYNATDTKWDCVLVRQEA